MKRKNQPGETKKGNRYDIEEFPEQTTDSTIEFEPDTPPVTLLSFDNLSEEEVSSLLILENNPGTNWVDRPETVGSTGVLLTGVLDLRLAGVTEIENGMLPVVLDSDTLIPDQIEFNNNSSDTTEASVEMAFPADPGVQRLVKSGQIPFPKNLEKLDR